MTTALINPLATYAHAGATAGRAMRRRDTALAEHERRWLTSALAIEHADNRQECRDAYANAYRQEATPNPPHETHRSHPHPA